MSSVFQKLMGLGKQHKEQRTGLWDTIQVFGVRKGSRKIHEEFGEEGAKSGL